MPAISLKLPDALLHASDRCASALKLSRSAYLRRAVERMNRETRASLRARKLAAASRKVRRDSMKVNAEFAPVERAPDA
jgi:predicted transcriptional regulator